MRRFIQTIAVILLCGALAAPSIDAQQSRGRSNQTGSQRTHQSANRGSSSSSRSDRPANRPTNRPGNSGQGQSQRPGGNQNSRPNNNGGNQGNRPGGNQNSRPNNGGYNGGSYSQRPGGYKPDHRPNNNGYHNGGHHYDAQHNHNHHGPARPHMHPHRSFYRPTPPPAWRAPHNWCPFHSILGITLGTAFNSSINALLHSGYVINSYGDNMIFLADVPMLNMIWPDAIMFYNSVGALNGSRFVYSTSAYNMNRYNVTYTSLVNTYGMPTSVQNVANGIEATWWGTHNQFIRLSYAAEYANNGSLRYYTTLSFGNY